MPSQKLMELSKVKPCTIIKRLNRFVVEIKIDSIHTYASINNTGKLQDFLVNGNKGYCVEKSTGKTGYKLIAVQDIEKASLIDTHLQMRAFEKALENKLIPWLANCKIIRRNPRVMKSVLDYLLENETYVEIKSAVLRVENKASYPDCPTERGRRHIRDLIELARKGKKAMIIFLAGLAKVKAFTPARWIDYKVADALVEAKREGVKIKALSMYFDPEDSTIVLENSDLPVKL